MIDPNSPDYTNTPASDRRPGYDYRPFDPTARPAATIVTPYYNTGEIFHDTARSVFRQSFQQWEWIIVNDASTNPEALSILDSYRNTDARIRVIDHEVNQGPSAARNTAYRAAHAPYAVQLDTDNLLEPTAIEKWLWLLESQPEFAFVKGYSVGFDAHEYLWERGFHNGGVFLEHNLVDITGAVRRSVYEAVGGYDETIRGGLEDWDFWLHCASEGYWGTTLPEYLDWYRRRENHGDRWETWDGGEREAAFRKKLRQRYPRLWDAFPTPQAAPLAPYETVSDTLPWQNRLKKEKPRLLLIVPWLALGGSDKFNLDLLGQLVRRGWEVTIATTLIGDHPWLAQFARSTPDIFILQHFLRPADYPRFLRYLIHSREMDAALVSHSEFGYHLLPYLRAHFPRLPLLDFCHIEEEAWKNGGYPQMSVNYQEVLDRSLVSSKHLKGWMEKRGAEPAAINVCHTNIDADYWQPDPDRSRRARQKYDLAASTPLIVFVGRVCAQKQPKVLAQTASRLAQVNADFVLVVAGDGPDFDWLKTYIRKNKLERQVRLVGTLSNTDIRDLLAAADIFFLPSEWEGIALSVYEALACGLPVVGADVGGQRELVTPECGVLIARGEEDAEAQQYATVLARLLAEPEQRQSLGQQGRQRIQEHFRLEQMTDTVLAAYEAARQEREAATAPVPGLGLGLACATQAVEYLRVTTVTDRLWTEREQGAGQGTGTSLIPAPPVAAYDHSWRTALYFSVRRRFLPFYEALLKRDRPWLVSLKNRFKRRLLRDGTP